MKTTFKSVVTALFCSLALMATSCDSNDSNPGMTFKDLNASSYADWTYFSFSKGDTVQVSDPATDLGWDIAFHRQDIRVNASEHFLGMGGIYKTDKTDFNAVVLGDVKSNYMGNTMANLRVKFTHKQEMPYVFEKQYYVTTGKKNEYTTYTVDMAKMRDGAKAMYPIVPNVYIVKAADGKSIYKFQVESSTGTKAEKGGFLNFKFDKIQ